MQKRVETRGELAPSHMGHGSIQPSTDDQLFHNQEFQLHSCASSAPRWVTPTAANKASGRSKLHTSSLITPPSSSSDERVPWPVQSPLLRWSSLSCTSSFSVPDAAVCSFSWSTSWAVMVADGDVSLPCSFSVREITCWRHR